jgi:hypothetical protein
MREFTHLRSTIYASAYASTILGLGVACLMLALAPGLARADVIDRVVAVVAGDVVMQSDLVAARDLGLVQVETVAPAEAGDPLRAILGRLIDRSLMLAEVDRYAPPEPSPAAVDVALQTVRARFEATADYEAALRRAGIDEAHLRGTLRQNLRIDAYLGQRFVVAPPTEGELAQFAQDQAGRLRLNGRPRPAAEARQLAIQLLNEERRSRLVAEWVAGLRRRADTLILY